MTESGWNAIQAARVPAVLGSHGRMPGIPMLEMRPGCECCDRDLPPFSPDARICTFECTFCAACAARLRDRCPNCGGGLVFRPMRPASLLERNPASTKRVFDPRKCREAMTP